MRRRSFLGGAAVAVGLPYLASLERGARAQADRRRLVCIFLPNGVWVPSWVPTAVGPDFELSPTLAPLARVKGKVNVISGLHNDSVSDSAGAHNYGPAGMLTCRLAQKGSTISVGVSMDQLVAQALAGKTPIQSMQLGLTDTGVSVDNGYAAVYGKVISWASPTQPLAPTIKPDVAFDRLFAGQQADATAAERAKRRALRTSVLDYVGRQARDLSPKLALSDRRKLDEYFSGIRELERQIQLTSTTAGAASCGGLARPAATLSMPDRVRAMMDLMVVALQCDATRVISFMMGCGGNGGLTFGFIGIPENHHPISHHQRQSTNIEKLKRIDLWEVTQIAYLLEKMDAVREGERTLLDSSLVLTSSEISDGDAHNQGNKPILMAGSAGGAFRTGRHLKFGYTPQANLMITILNAFGVAATSFGANGTRPLAL